MFWILFAVALLFAVGCDVYDVTETGKGLKAGVAVEGNTFLLSSNKPSAKALYARDLSVIAATAAPALIASFLNPAIAFGLLVGPVAAGIKHIMGGRQWAALLAGQAPTTAEKYKPE